MQTFLQRIVNSGERIDKETQGEKYGFGVQRPLDETQGFQGPVEGYLVIFNHTLEVPYRLFLNRY